MFLIDDETNHLAVAEESLFSWLSDQYNKDDAAKDAARRVLIEVSLERWHFTALQTRARLVEVGAKSRVAP